MTGPLKGKPKNFVPLTSTFEENAPAVEILAHLVMGAIIHAPANSGQELPPETGFATRTLQLLNYKARPLDGIWATAPYLHNGSVPTLRDLLSAVKDRPKTFFVGQREYDPKAVGFRQFKPGDETEQAKKLGFFLFDTSKEGNWNTGHVYGAEEFSWKKKDASGNEVDESVKPLTPEEREALLEYLRSL